MILACVHLFKAFSEHAKHACKACRECRACLADIGQNPLSAYQNPYHLGATTHEPSYTVYPGNTNIFGTALTPSTIFQIIPPWDKSVQIEARGSVRTFATFPRANEQWNERASERTNDTEEINRDRVTFIYADQPNRPINRCAHVPNFNF